MGGRVLDPSESDPRRSIEEELIIVHKLLMKDGGRKEGEGGRTRECDLQIHLFFQIGLRVNRSELLEAGERNFVLLNSTPPTSDLAPEQVLSVWGNSLPSPLHNNGRHSSFHLVNKRRPRFN